MSPFHSAPRILPALALALSAGALTFFAPTEEAHADVFKFWFAARGDFFSGTSDIFQEFDQPFGGSLELGTELFFVNVFAEGLIMGPDQFLVTGNLGFDTSIGKRARLNLGIYTGPLLFIFPEGEPPEGVNFDRLSPNERDALEAYVAQSGEFESLDEMEAEFNTYSQREQDLSRLAFGWNLARVRVGLDVALTKVIYLGVSGEAGYHYIISGEDAAAGAKNAAVDEFAKEYDLDPVAQDAMREAVGAEAIDPNDLNGFNYAGNVYLRFEFASGNLDDDDYK